jgi:Tfp pilus assembly pilus retraction ATPase PilT
MLRVDGALVSVTGAEALTEETVETLLYAILDEDQKQILLKDKEFDFSFCVWRSRKIPRKRLSRAGKPSCCTSTHPERNAEYRTTWTTASC